MKISDRPTPIVDAQARMMKEVNRLNVYTGQSCEVISAEEARSLERRLTHATDQLIWTIHNSPDGRTRVKAEECMRDIAASKGK